MRSIILLAIIIINSNSYAQTNTTAAKIKCAHGDYALESGYYDDAIKIFEECIKQCDSIPEAMYGAAKGYFHISDYAKAFKMVNLLLEDDSPEFKSSPLLQNASRLAALIEDAKNSSFEMVYVHGGSYVRGCIEGIDIDCEDEERPSHIADVNDFYIGKYEVTQAQWKSIMGKNPSHFTGCDDCPVETVSWDTIQIFIDKLNRKYPSMKFRLPTEAEWEYAARGGKKSKSYKYCGSNDPDEIGWFDKNSGNTTHPVGTKKSNELGIHDMGGNVWEWCADWFYNYAGINTEIGRGMLAKSHRADRGGCWQCTSKYVRPGARGGLNPQEISNDLGFRLARDVR